MNLAEEVGFVERRELKKTVVSRKKIGHFQDTFISCEKIEEICLSCSLRSTRDLLIDCYVLLIFWKR